VAVAASKVTQAEEAEVATKSHAHTSTLQKAALRAIIVTCITGRPRQLGEDMEEHQECTVMARELKEDSLSSTLLVEDINTNRTLEEQI
jgi:hypothetical protein